MLWCAVGLVARQLSIKRTAVCLQLTSGNNRRAADDSNPDTLCLVVQYAVCFTSNTAYSTNIQHKVHYISHYISALALLYLWCSVKGALHCIAQLHKSIQQLLPEGRIPHDGL